MARKVMDLPVELTAPERQQWGTRVAGLVGEIGKLNAEKKHNAGIFKEKIDEAQDELSKLSSELRAGEHTIPVEVHEVFDYDSGKVDIIRKDTEELVTSREMSISERQVALPEVD